MVLTDPHPLVGAYNRANRAQHHIGELTGIVEEMDENSWAEPGDAAGKLQLHLTFTMDRFDIIVGETVYNLRAALDYLVYALACSQNEGEHVPRTQFPIEASLEVFEARITGMLPPRKGEKKSRRVTAFLAKLDRTAIDKLRELQPFAGCEWTKLVAALSNPDKHRKLIDHAQDGTLPYSRAAFVAKVTAIGRRTKLSDLGVPTKIVVSESGEPILPTLVLLEKNVRLTLDDFAATEKFIPFADYDATPNTLRFAD